MRYEQLQCDISVQTTSVRGGTFDIARAWNRFTAILAQSSSGRIVLHLLAMAGDRCVRFHIQGIIRELPRLASAWTQLARVRTSLVESFVCYLVQPVKSSGPQPGVDSRALASVLNCGDVLLSDGNTRIAALVKRITQSPWSHVSLYVGPLDDGPDPRCIVEADLAAGVRSIRISELNALQIRVLRPIGLDDADRCRLKAWVTSRIGCKYDLAHAWAVGRKLLLPTPFRSVPDTVAFGARRFICCSLLANAFALVGYLILPDAVRCRLGPSADQRYLTPADFERAAVFQVIEPAGQTAQTKVSVNTIVQ